MGLGGMGRFAVRMRVITDLVKKLVVDCRDDTSADHHRFMLLTAKLVDHLRDQCLVASSLAKEERGCDGTRAGRGYWGG